MRKICVSVIDRPERAIMLRVLRKHEKDNSKVKLRLDQIENQVIDDAIKAAGDENVSYEKRLASSRPYAIALMVKNGTPFNQAVATYDTFLANELNEDDSRDRKMIYHPSEAVRRSNHKMLPLGNYASRKVDQHFD